MKLWHVQAEGMDGQIAVSPHKFEQWLASEDYQEWDSFRDSESKITIFTLDACDVEIVYTLTLVEVIGAAE